MIYPICFFLLALAIGLTAYRLFRGPTSVDRVLAIDLLAVSAAAAVIVYALAGDEAVFVDVVVVLGVIVFFGTVALARTISRNPRDP
jgi:multicomponent Na+:H+ antiporter subunit F